MADKEHLDVHEEDKRHVDRVWMYDEAWIKQESKSDNTMTEMDVPEEKIVRAGFVGYLIRYPLLVSFLLLLAGGMAFIVIGLLLF